MGKFRVGDIITIQPNDYPIFSKYQQFQGVIDKIGGGYTVILQNSPNQSGGLPIHKNSPVIISNNDPNINRQIGVVKKKHPNHSYTVSVGGSGEAPTSLRLPRNELQVLYNTLEIPKNIFGKIAVKTNPATGGATVNVNPNNLLCSNLCKSSGFNSPLGKAKDCPQDGWRKLSESRKCLKKTGDYNNPNAWTCCNTYRTSGCYDLCVKKKNSTSVAPLGKTRVKGTFGYHNTRRCFLKQNNPYTNQEEAELHNCRQYKPSTNSSNVAQPRQQYLQQQYLQQQQKQPPGQLQIYQKQQSPQYQQPQSPQYQQPQSPQYQQQQPQYQQPQPQPPQYQQPQQLQYQQAQPPQYQQPQQPQYQLSRGQSQVPVAYPVNQPNYGTK